jgi:carotenoid cleavage dioxygenase
MASVAILPYCPGIFCLHLCKGHIWIQDNFLQLPIAVTILIWSNCSTFSDVVKVLEDGDLQTLGLLDYDKRLKHSFTAHPKVDPFTGKFIDLII